MLCTIITIFYVLHIYILSFTRMISLKLIRNQQSWKSFYTVLHYVCVSLIYFSLEVEESLKVFRQTCAEREKRLSWLLIDDFFTLWRLHFLRYLKVCLMIRFAHIIKKCLRAEKVEEAWREERIVSTWIEIYPTTSQ